jgi:hypothetical protein
MIFCRYCGAAIADDSLFCAKCGRKLGRRVNPRAEKIIRVLRLRTPYPYAAVLLLLAGGWLVLSGWQTQIPVDYTGLKWTLKSNRKLDLPDEKLYQEGFSLILENGGTAAVRQIPVDFTAKIEPPQRAEIEARFLGQRHLVMHEGRVFPLTVILEDQVAPGKKHTFGVEGSIQAEAPFKVTYEIRERDSKNLLASYVVER